MHTFLITVLSVLSAIFFFTACEKKKVAETIDFGVQGPETGEIAVYGLQTLYGAQLAVKEINADGGINGKPLRIVHYDSRGDKQEAVNVAQRLINVDKVCAVLGEPTSGATFAIRSILNESKTVEISAGATAKDVPTAHPFVFRNTLLDDDGGPATIDFLMKTKGWKDFAIITSVNNDYSVGLSESFRKAIADFGGTVVAEQSINDKDTNVSAQVTAMKSKKFDAVVYSGYYQEASLILLELRKQGIPAPLVGGDGLQSPELYNVAKDAAIGTVFFAGFSTFSPDAKVVAFNEKIKGEGADSDMFAAQGYDAIYLLTNAARAAGVTDCTDPAQRTKLRDELAVVKNFPGVSGEMSFDAEGNAVKKPFIQEVYKGEDGNYKLRLLN
ncbi:MAG: ABC transporter substrate-binding protein [Deferribacteraceae bacterium]|jgi:branched-chain amino acid transport system substrate-binding protein|nr:ABC transporter substrate-binding protein [Deferribacteraceae bacterium]